MPTQISKEAIDILARLIRHKMVYWEWEKIVEGQNREMWDNKQVFEALSVAINYKYEEKTQVEYFYVITMAGTKFVVIKDMLTNKIKVFYPIKEGYDLRTEKPFLEFTEEMLEDLGQ